MAIPLKFTPEIGNSAVNAIVTMGQAHNNGNIYIDTGSLNGQCVSRCEREWGCEEEIMGIKQVWEHFKQVAIIERVWI